MVKLPDRPVTLGVFTQRIFNRDVLCVPQVELTVTGCFPSDGVLPTIWIG